MVPVAGVLAMDGPVAASGVLAVLWLALLVAGVGQLPPVVLTAVPQIWGTPCIVKSFGRFCHLKHVSRGYFPGMRLEHDSCGVAVQTTSSFSHSPSQECKMGGRMQT